MRVNNSSITKNTDVQILLVGNVESRILDGTDLRELHCDHCDTVLDAITLAEKQTFTAIVVAISSFGDNGIPRLDTLKRASGNSRIILLAEMYEEPVAMKLVKHGWHEKRVADDYLISPVESRRFSQIVMGRRIQHNGILVAKLSEKAADKDELISELEKLATEDDLTKIKNRRYMWEFFRQIIERAKKENLQATLLVFDIDDFKHYNDSYGHTVGDAILKQVAILMRRCCRKHDVVGRIGGDEFAVIFWDCPSEANSEQDDSSSAEAGSERRTIHAEHPKDAIILADRLRKELNSAESPLLGKEGKGELTISGGLASFPRDGKNVEQLFEQADKALLQAKHSGKNRIYLVGGPREDIAENSKL